MVNSADTDHEDKPLDPAVERVQKKLRRLILVAGLTLGIGLIAIFAGIIYRVSTLDGKARPANPSAVAAAAIPEGARLVSTTPAGPNLVLTYEHPGGTTLVLIDAARLQVIGRLDLKPGEPAPELSPPNTP
jgi:hypothetical protein